MGGDHCTVFGCGNDRRYPDRYVIKDHVTTLKFHSCREKHYGKWTKLLNIRDHKVGPYTRVCSNHFRYGQPFADDLHPSLFLKGYVETLTPKRKPPTDRTLCPTSAPKAKKTSHVTNQQQHSIGVQVNPCDFEQHLDHQYGYATPINMFSGNYVAHLEEQLYIITESCKDLQLRLSQAVSDLENLEAQQNSTRRAFTIADIGHSDELIKLYTGIPSYHLYKWVLREVEPHAKTLHYFKGKSSFTDKQYQKYDQIKPGPKREQTLEDEMLMTLMKLRLNLREDDLAFRFKVSQSTVSQVISTWLPFLHKELNSFIYWPTQDEILKYYPQCFHRYRGTVRAIIDCTEIQIDRPSLASSNAQVYSQYKSRPTLKCLVAITPAGTISFISKPAGGNTSDKMIVKMTNIVDKFEKNDIVLADRGFNIQELFLHKQVKVVLPPFQRTTSSTSQFTETENTTTKTVANARIHVERAIGRLKEFSILQGPIPLTMIDLMESALVVCSALVNLQPVLVPLSS